MMGGSESVVRNVDKRTARREHRQCFEAAVARFRKAPFEAPAPPRGNSAHESGFRVCVRKRPFFQHEAEQGEFDVLSCLSERIVVHDARMHPDMRNMFMNHHDFSFDEVFGETVDNEAVYQDTACNLVDTVVDGGQATIMMYGQTGSGKTYTMSALHKRVAEDLFDRLAKYAAPESTQRPPTVTIYFIELLGDSCFDMLNGGAPCNLVGAVDGSVHPHPSVEVGVQDASELLALIRMAGKLRATAATGVHDQSSRSHAICRVFVRDAGDADSEGCLTLVDLAGTEHRIDNAEHNAERQREGAKINASLAALKDCIRASAAGNKFVAFRQNRLTQLLRGCFVHHRPHPTIVIATVSPSSKDTEHSLNTLRHACIMDGQGEGKGKSASSHLTGGIIRKEMLGEIDVTAIARARAAKRAGRASQVEQADVARIPPAHQSKQSNTTRRAGLDRRCVESLPPEVAKRLLEARAAAMARGTDRQRMRLQGRESESYPALDESISEWSDQQMCHGSSMRDSVNNDGEFMDSQADQEMDILKTQEEFIKACLPLDPNQQHADWTQDSHVTRHALDDLLSGPFQQHQVECDLIGHCSELDNQLRSASARPQAAPVEVDMRDFSCSADDGSFANHLVEDAAPIRASDDMCAHLAPAHPQRRRIDEATAAAARLAPVAAEMEPPADAFVAEPAVDSAAQSDCEKASALFRLFCSEGRCSARTWRKNDLRLINTCVVQAFFGPCVQIDWAHPNAALDELERLVAQNPQMAAQFQASAQQAPQAVPLRSTPQQVPGQGRSAGSSNGFVQDAPPSGWEQQANSLRKSWSEGCQRKVGQDDQHFRARRRSIENNLAQAEQPVGTMPSRRRATDGHMANLEQQVDTKPSRRRSTDKNMANLEQQVASAEASARRWLAELREEQHRCDTGTQITLTCP